MQNSNTQGHTINNVPNNQEQAGNISSKHQQMEI